MKLTGWVIYNGFLQGDKFRDFAEMLAAAGEARGHQMKLMKNTEILNRIDACGYNNLPSRPDYVLFTDKDIYLASMFEALGIRVFNSSRSIAISDDKIKTQQQLAKEQLPMPKTIVAPISYGLSWDKQRAFLEKVIAELGFPMIIKEAFGSFGEQVYLINNEADLFACLQQIKIAPFLFQEFIASSYGIDLRVQVVGGRVVAAMKRRAQNDFRANVTSGASMEPHTPNALEIELAIRATAAIGADFAGVDLLFGPGEKRFICEVNANAHIRNLYTCTGINAADDIVRHIETVIT